MCSVQDISDEEGSDVTWSAAEDESKITSEIDLFEHESSIDKEILSEEPTISDCSISEVLGDDEEVSSLREIVSRPFETATQSQHSSQNLDHGSNNVESQAKLVAEFQGNLKRKSSTRIKSRNQSSELPVSKRQKLDRKQSGIEVQQEKISVDCCAFDDPSITENGARGSKWEKSAKPKQKCPKNQPGYLQIRLKELRVLNPVPFKVNVLSGKSDCTGKFD